MTTSRRNTGLLVAILLTAFALAQPADAARRSGGSRVQRAAIVDSDGTTDAASSWLGRAWSWLTSLIGADNGGIHPTNPPPTQP